MTRHFGRDHNAFTDDVRFVVGSSDAASADTGERIVYMKADGLYGIDEDGMIVRLSAFPNLGILPSYAAEPHSGTETEGESYYDTTDHMARTWNGSVWKDWWA